MLLLLSVVVLWVGVVIDCMVIVVGLLFVVRLEIISVVLMGVE